ncbi:MAG: SBBP repeat-containing protein [bacterium]
MKKIWRSVLVLGIYGQIAQAAEGGYEFVWKQPSISLHFNYPHGIAVDSSGNVYVADTDNNRIQKFRPLR